MGTAEALWRFVASTSQYSGRTRLDLMFFIIYMSAISTEIHRFGCRAVHVQRTQRSRREPDGN